MIIIDIFDNENLEGNHEICSEKSTRHQIATETKEGKSLCRRFSSLAMGWKIALSQPRKDATGNQHTDKSESS